MKKILTLVMVIAMLASMAVTTSAAEMPADYIAYFTFEDEASLTTDLAVATPNNAAADGSAVAEFAEGHNGQGIYIANPGDTAYWLEVLKADGSSLLAGLEECTISYWSCIEGATNWAYFVTPNIDGVPHSQTYLASELYIGALENGNGLTAERHNLVNAGGRPVALSGMHDYEWNMFTIVYKEGSYELYQNGEYWTYADSPDALLTDILTDDHSFLIGTATWGGLGNEGFTGTIDDFVVYPRALTEEEVIDLCVAQGGEAPEVETEEPETEAPADDTTAAPAEDTTAAPADDTTAAPAETNAPAEEGGCGSSMGMAALAVALVSTLGCAIIKKH